MDQNPKRVTQAAIESAYDDITMAVAPRPEPPDRALVYFTTILVLVTIGVAGHYWSPLLLPKADVSARPSPGCDLQREACSAALPDGARIELSITPRPIPFLQTLRVEVTIAGTKGKKVVVDFAGETMNMGYNRSELPATGGGRFAGTASLPVCVAGRMVWIATVQVETDRQRIAVPYRFEVGH